MLDRTIPPPPKNMAEINVVQANKYSFSNGLPLYYINSGAQEVLKLELVANAGSRFDEVKGSSFFASKMLTEGTKKHTSKELAEIFDFYGAQIEITPGFDFSSLNIYTLSKNLPSILPILTEILRDSIFGEKELGLQKSLKKDSLRVNQEKNQFVASRKIREVLFGQQHPYGQSLELEDIDEIKAEQVTEFYQKTFLNRPTVIASGRILESDIQVMEEHLGMLLVGDSSFALSGNIATQKEVIIDRNESLQSSIRLGKVALPKNHPDYLSTLVVNEILGGYFGSRLMKNIREEKGFTYGIYSNIMNLKQSALQVIGTDVKKEFREQTIEEIRKEIQKLNDEAIGSDELETVKNYMQGSFLSSINTPFSLADKFKAIHFHDLDYSFYDQYLNTINSISAIEIQETARKYFNPEDYSLVVVG